MIIGINGKIGSGKDTVGKIIQYLQCHNTGEITIEDVISNPEHEWWLEEQSKFEIKKFAGKLKQTASLLTGVDVEKFEDQEFKQQYMSEEWNNPNPVIYENGNKAWMPMTYREFLQKLGTEAMRDGLHTNVWVNALFADYKPSAIRSADSFDLETYDGKYPNWIITDMRFENELEAVVKHKGITIKVVRPGRTLTGTHPSEIALDGFIMHYEIINDGTIEDLIEKVKEILIKENII
jgi:ABC-type oligopeptide transport system ATPase subunit